MLSQSRVIRGNVVFFCRSCTSSTRRQLCRPQLYCCKCVGAFVANRTFPCLLASAKARAVPGHLCSSPCHPGVRMVCPPSPMQPFSPSLGTTVGQSHHQQRRTGNTPRANCQETRTYMFPPKNPKEGNKAKPRHNRGSSTCHTTKERSYQSRTATGSTAQENKDIQCCLTPWLTAPACASWSRWRAILSVQKMELTQRDRTP